MSSIIEFVVILHGIEGIWHSNIFGDSRYRLISVAYSVYEWAGGTHILAYFFVFLLPHVAESLFLFLKRRVL